MDLSLTAPPPYSDGTASKEKDSMVDPFLVEALQNPRHRLTILRMELDVQRFLRNTNQELFEFQQSPTSYLRLAAHRVAQHYNLQTLVQDNTIEGLGIKILVKKTVESKYPSVLLSEIPAKLVENDKPENMKIAIKPRPNKAIDEANGSGIKRSHVKTMEERKEDYEKARARIFSSPSSSDSDDTFQAPATGKQLCLMSREEIEVFINEPERNCIKDGPTLSRVAILKDKEKDRIDPDYDRSYQRYVRSLPMTQSFNMGQLNLHKNQLPFVPYETGFPQMGRMPIGTQAPVNYRPLPSNAPFMTPFCGMGHEQTPRNAAAYMQWPSPAMMNAAGSYVIFQAPLYQHQPLSFDYSHYH